MPLPTSITNLLDLPIAFFVFWTLVNFLLFARELSRYCWLFKIVYSPIYIIFKIPAFILHIMIQMDTPNTRVQKSPFNFKHQQRHTLHNFWKRLCKKKKLRFTPRRLKNQDIDDIITKPKHFIAPSEKLENTIFYCHCPYGSWPSFQAILVSAVWKVSTTLGQHNCPAGLKRLTCLSHLSQRRLF